MSNVFKAILSILFFLNTGIITLYAQPTEPIPLQKPEKYKNKKLGSEKTGEKKLKAPRRFIQNTVTHYNWYYNANTKLDMILERAKMAHQDDYSTILSFYPYSLENTLADSLELDSVITKSSTGILIHDLRNDWIDNLFLLIGKAYYFKNEFDSAYRTFQYINYIYSPKDKNDYRIPIGSNSSEGGSAMKISTVESKSLPKKIFSIPPSRNDALIWQVKAHIGNKDFGSASGLIEILKNDPDFPERLYPHLAEMQALYYYETGIPDSAAFYLTQALPKASNKNEMARWEFLIAQLYELSEDIENARKYYESAIKRTTNPVLEVYARLAALKQHPGDEYATEEQLNALLKMGRREKYIAYRDIIYYAAAQIELDRGNMAAAKKWLKAAVDTRPNPGFIHSKRNAALLALGDIAFSEGEFREAGYYYESISPSDPSISDPAAFSSRINQLQNLVTSYDVIIRQDSLQQLASLPEAERDRILRSEVRKYRKLTGMDDESSDIRRDRNQETQDLFNQRSKGDWYFYNNSLKSRGYNEFIAKWGNRENADNWRRSGMQRGGNLPAGVENITTAENPYSYEALLSNIPLSIEQMELSNDSIESAKIAIGKIFFQNLEDYEMVVKTLESFPEDYPYSGRLGEALYYLYFSYNKLGKTELANQVRAELNEKFEGSPYEKQVNMVASGQVPDDPAIAMNQKYHEIYNLFIEGDFSNAVDEKAKADSIYGNHYWTPQLLYIESIYYIRQRNDSRARQVLSQIVNRFPEHAMKEKAETMINVLGRRREIENYLTNLEITIPDEEEITVYQPKDVKSIPDDPKDAVAKNLRPTIIEEKQPEKPEIQAPRERGELPLAKITQPVIEPRDTMQREEPEPVEVEKDSITLANTDKPVIKDSSAPAPIEKPADSVTASEGRLISGSFVYERKAPHHVVMVLEKVDQVYISESRNAFNLYNRARVSALRIEIENLRYSDSLNFVIMKGFSNADEALKYTQNVEEEASVTIVPWLPSEKYYFIVISEENLQKLIETGNIPGYQTFEAQYLRRNIE